MTEMKKMDRVKGMKEQNLSLEISIRKFSDLSMHKPGVLTAVSDASLKDCIIKCVVGAYYGNGNNEDNEGYVSLVFNCHVPLIFKRRIDFTFSCVVAVQDVNGNRKFVRTFAFDYDASSKNAGNDPLAVYCIDRYISRETLLDDRNTLLPGDELNLIIDINVQTVTRIDNSAEIESSIDSSFEIKNDSEGPIIVLNLYSKLAQRLYEESAVFRALCDIPMLENSTGIVYLRNDDAKAFKKAGRIIMGVNYITFNVFSEIVDLYVFADKYDIQYVIRACRNFCNSILNVENAWGTFDLIEERVDKISHLATFYNDDILKVIVYRFLKNLKDDPVESRKKCEHRNLNLGNLKCEYYGDSPYLYFDLEEEKDCDRSEYEFYH